MEAGDGDHPSQRLLLRLREGDNCAYLEEPGAREEFSLGRTSVRNETADNGEAAGSRSGRRSFLE